LYENQWYVVDVLKITLHYIHVFDTSGCHQESHPAGERLLYQPRDFTKETFRRTSIVVNMEKWPLKQQKQKWREKYLDEHYNNMT